MTQLICKTGKHQTDHRTFGGVIYASDFNTDCRKNNSASGSAIARRIVRDLAFDRECMVISTMANAARKEAL